MTRWTLLWCTTLGGVLAGAGAAGVRVPHPRQPLPPAPLPVAWLPDSLRQGSAVIIVLGPDTATGGDSVAAVYGAIAGESLRLERGVDGRFRALAAIPVNARGSVLVPLTVVRRADTVYQLARLQVSGGGFRTARIRLPPRFVSPPDSLAPRLAEERRTIREALARTAATPRLWHAAFGQPLPGRVTDAFGTRREVNLRFQSQHLGVDLAGQTGTPVRAANRGIVVVAGPFYYQGNAAYLDHGAGLVTSYMHLSRILVSPGDTVVVGQVIGQVGATGRVTGPHLHWTAYFGHVLFDPLSLLTPEVTEFAQRE